MGKQIRLVHVVSSEMALGPFFAGQIRFMAAQGIDVTLCSPAAEAARRFAASEDARYVPCRMERKIAPGQDLESVLRLSRILRRVRPHIIHAHGPKAGIVGMAAGHLARIPVRICHVHGLPFLSDTQPQRLLRATMRVTSRLAHRVLSVSPSIARELVAAGCCPTEKIRTLRSGSINGIDADGRFNPHRFPAEVRRAVRREIRLPEDAQVVGFVGRVVRDKGITELLAAWNQLRHSHANLHLLVVGPLERRDAIPAEARAQLLSDPRIRYLGEDRDTPRLYAAMDLFVLPSYREGLGLVLLEAGAMELPVIATNIPGCIDAVQDGVTGTLVPPRDATALAGAIAHYMRSPNLGKQHGKNGRARVLNCFQPREIWEATYAEYVALLKRRGIVVPSPHEIAVASAA